jgi:pilus assembly protein CpaC
MIEMNTSKARRIKKLARAVGAGLLAAGIVAMLPATTMGQVADSATSPSTTAGGAAAPTTMPATRGTHRLVADGLGPDGAVHLMVNKTTVLTTRQPFKQVSVGQTEIADVNLIGPNTILVTAKKQGTTQLIIWNDNNQSQVADIVVDIDLGQLQSAIGGMFPGSKIQVSSMNGSVALRGQVADVRTAEQAVSAAQPFSTKPVLNFLEVGGGQQVMLQVRFAEVSRQATNALGVNFAVTDGTFAMGSNIGQVAPSNFLDAGTVGPGNIATNSGAGVTLFGSGQIGSVAFRAFLQALRQNNLLRILAEPNLVATSGQEASFLAGGEFPVPVPQSGVGGAATITIDYREFGIRLRFVPIVLGNGRISLKLTPEVSDLDFSSPLTIQGSRIPIVNKRTVTTTVELADGQTFAIAGLLDHSVNASKDVTPLLGDIPVLGALFRSVRYERRETELVVLVTPKLVEPMNPGQVPALPGENWRLPSELEIWNGDIGGEQSPKAAPTSRPSDGRAESVPAGPAPRYRGSYGFTPPPPGAEASADAAE